MTAAHGSNESSAREHMSALDFTELYRRHLGSIRAYASAAVATTDIDDVVAEVFAIAWQRRADIPVDWARGWLIGVTRNTVRSRRRSVRRAASFIDQLADGRPTPPQGPADQHLEAEQFDALEAAMQKLRSTDREILMFAGPYEMSPGDIAAALDITENNVGVRLHRARQRLRTAYDQTTQNGGEVA